MTTTRKPATILTLLTFLILAAAFMPWGQRSGVEPHVLPLGENKLVSYDAGPFPSTKPSLTMTGWNGRLTLVGLELPNWLVVLAAATVAVLYWLKVLSLWPAPAFLVFAVAGYGVLQAVITFVVLVRSYGASPGVGLLLTLFCFICVLKILVHPAHS